MNKVFKTIFNEVLGAWVAVSECAKSNGKKSKSLLACAVAMSSLFTWGVALADQEPPIPPPPLKPEKTLVQDENGNISDAYSELDRARYSIALLYGRVMRHPDETSGTTAPEGGVAIGYLATVLGGTDSFAIGHRAKVDNGVIQGPKGKFDSDVDGHNNFAIGTKAEVSPNKWKQPTQFGFAVGYKAKVNANWSFAVGHNSLASGSYSFALGHGAQALSTHSFALGTNSIAAVQSTVALGFQTKALSWDSVSVGMENISGHDGYQTKYTDFDNLREKFFANLDDPGILYSINPAGSYMDNEVLEQKSSERFAALIREAKDSAENGEERYKEINQREVGATALGFQNYALLQKDVAVGYKNLVVGLESAAFGIQNIAKGYRSLAFGRASYAWEEGSFADGLSAVAMKKHSIASGINSIVIGENSVGMGFENIVMNAKSTSLGSNNKVNAELGVAVGSNNNVGFLSTDTLDTLFPNDANIWKDDKRWEKDPASLKSLEKNATQITAFGSGNTVKSLTGTGNTTATGTNNTIFADNSVATGHNNNLNNEESKKSDAGFMVAYGTDNKITENYSVAVGNKNNVTAANTVVLGNNVTAANIANSVYLGDSSATNGYVKPTVPEGANWSGVSTETTPGTSGTPRASTTLGVVTVGSAGKERQIQHVAAGRVSADSTDAINGSQLDYYVKDLTSKITTATSQAGDSLQSIVFNTNINGFTYDKNKSSIFIKGLDGNNNKDEFDSGKNILTYIDGEGIRIGFSNSPVLQNLTLTGTNNAAPKINFKIGSTDNVLMLNNNGSSGPGVTGNKERLNFKGEDIATLNDGYVVSGTTGKNNALLNTELNFVGDDNVTTTVTQSDGKTTIKIELKNNPSAQGEIKVGANNPAEKGGANPVAGVKDLDIVGASTNSKEDPSKFDGGRNIQTTVKKDADSGKTTVTVALKNDLESNTLTVGGDGQNKKPKADGKINVVDKKGNTTVKITSGSEAEGTNPAVAPSVKVSSVDGQNLTSLEATGLTISAPATPGTTAPAVSLNATGLHIKDGPSVTKDGIDAGGRVISNVAAGVKPTDAVNVSQLNKTRNDLINRMDANHEQALGSAAMAMAMANLPHAIRPGDKTVSVAGSTVHGKAAFAVGISSSSLTGKWQLRGSVSGSDNGDIGAGIGAGYTWR